MKKAVVTGAAGLIGSNLCLELERKGVHVIAIDDLSSGSILNLKEFKGELFVEDFREISWASLFDKKKFGPGDVIYHNGAISDTRRTDERKILQVNYEVFKEILLAASYFDVRVVYASSAAVYGKGKPPMKETDKLNPLNAYGVSKLYMENFAKQMEANAIGLRYFNVFGPREFHKKDYASMVTQMYMKMKKFERPELFIDGYQLRDQVYVKDVVEANILAGKSDYNGVVNIGFGYGTTFRNIFELWDKLLKTEFIEPIWIKNPYPFYQDHTQADISLAKEKIGYVPKWPFEKAVKDYYKWLKDNG